MNMRITLSDRATATIAIGRPRSNMENWEFLLSSGFSQFVIEVFVVLES